MNVVAGSTISLGYDADPDATSSDANQHWIENGEVTAANGTGSYTWNTTCLAPGTYYLNGYMTDSTTGSPSWFCLDTPFVVTATPIADDPVTLYGYDSQGNLLYVTVTYSADGITAVTYVGDPEYDPVRLQRAGPRRSRRSIPSRAPRRQYRPSRSMATTPTEISSGNSTPIMLSPTDTTARPGPPARPCPIWPPSTYTTDSGG